MSWSLAVLVAVLLAAAAPLSAQKGPPPGAAKADGPLTADANGDGVFEDLAGRLAVMGEDEELDVIVRLAVPASVPGSTRWPTRSATST